MRAHTKHFLTPLRKINASKCNARVNVNIFYILYLACNIRLISENLSTRLGYDCNTNVRQVHAFMKIGSIPVGLRLVSQNAINQIMIHGCKIGKIL